MFSSRKYTRMFGFPIVAALSMLLLSVTDQNVAHAQGAPAPAAAAQAGQKSQEGADSRRINLGVGKSVIVDLPRDASEIFIADPKVVTAIVRSARKLYIIANTGGQTSVFALDPQGNRIASLEITVGRDIAELLQILKTAMPNTNIIPKTVNDTIILTGTVDSASDAQVAVDIAKGFVTLASSVPGAPTSGTVVNSIVIKGRDQVMLKVTIAEVQRNVMKQLGVTNAIARGNWGSISLGNSLTNQLTTGGIPLGSYDAASAVGSVVNGLAGQLQVYERQGVAKVLAEPTVTAVSGENAKFTAGGEIPVPGSQSCTGGVCTTGVNFKPYGVTLNFSPVVLSEGKILLRIATEVTEIDPTATFSFNTVSVSGFRTRKNETTVELPSGGSIATAGLIQTTSRATINGIPGLMNLPVLGALFRSREYQRQETELMIIVTPYIAKPVAPNELSRPGDGFADASDPQAVFLGRVNRVYSSSSNPEALGKYNGPVGFIND